MGITRPTEKYDDILANIKVGDTVSIYYRPLLNSYPFVISKEYFYSLIYQLSINSKTYLKIDDVESSHKKFGMTLLLFGISIYIGAIYLTITSYRK
jgi:hypothetical protein